MAKKSKLDWFNAGLGILSRAGVDGLTIQALCQELAVTKGSFYHHFEHREDFKSSLLAYYEQVGTLAIIEQTDAVAAPVDRLHQLLRIIIHTSTLELGYPEVTIRVWAHRDVDARAVVERVDAQRTAYVAALAAEILGDSQQGQQFADMLYAILIGCEQIMPPIVGDSLQALFNGCLIQHRLPPIPTV